MGGDENNRAFQEAISAPVDLIIMQWNQSELDSKKNDQILEIDTVQKVKLGSGKSKLVIVNKSFGDFDPTRGEVQDLDIQMQWDSNRDGVPDEGAPSWLAPINLSFVQQGLLEERKGYKNWAYLNQHYLYLVRYWEQEWISHIKEFIDKLANNSWDGIFLDVVGASDWLKEDNLRKEIYTNEEIANFTFDSLKEINKYITNKWPNFKLIINGSVTSNWIKYKPEILSLVDGLILESRFFYSGNSDRDDNFFPTQDKFEHYRGEEEFINLKSYLKNSSSDALLLPVEALEYDNRSFTQLCRLSEKYQLIPDIKFDQQQRLYDDYDTTIDYNQRFSINPHFYSLVDIEGKNKITNNTDLPSMMIGLEGNDEMTGSDKNDFFMGGEGDDYINGMNGLDTAIYKHKREKYNINKSEISNEFEISIKPEYKDLNLLKFTLRGFPLPDENPRFFLQINETIIADNEEVINKKDKVFEYEFTAPVTSIIFKLNNQRYNSELKKSIDLQIISISINDNKVDLSKVEFLDEKESWAEYNETHDLINPGAGLIKLDTSELMNITHHEGADSLIGIERLSFTDQDLFIVGGEYKPVTYIGEISEKNYSGNSSDYKFYNLGGNNYGIETKSGIDEFTGSTVLKFEDIEMNLTDVIATGKIINDDKNTPDYSDSTDLLINESLLSSTNTFTQSFTEYKFYNRGNGKYEIETPNGFDDLTGMSDLSFTNGTSSSDDDKTLNLVKDIKGTFDQITGKEDHTGQMFRLYNAAFARFPDAGGLAYWIDVFGSGTNTKRQVANSFLGSEEFSERYGANVSDSLYVDTLYTNVLGRLPDAEGKAYWVGRLTSGAETRAEALLGFAESAENKALFSDMTGVF